MQYLRQGMAEPAAPTSERVRTAMAETSAAERLAALEGVVAKLRDRIRVLEIVVAKRGLAQDEHGQHIDRLFEAIDRNSCGQPWGGQHGGST